MFYKFINVFFWIHTMYTKIFVPFFFLATIFIIFNFFHIIIKIQHVLIYPFNSQTAVDITIEFQCKIQHTIAKLYKSIKMNEINRELSY